MPDLNPHHLQQVMHCINTAPFFRHLSMRVTRLEKGLSEVSARLSTVHINPFGGLHGGVFSSLIDTAAYWSAYCDIAEDQGLVTIDLKVDLLRPVSGKQVKTVGTLIKTGKTLFLTQAQMLDDAGKTLAHGTSKLLVTRNKQTISDVVDFTGAAPMPPKFVKLSHAV